MESIGNALKISAALASEQAIVSRLMQLYQHDFSEFARADQSWGDVDDDGLFSYIYLDSQWTEDRRKPLLFRVNDKLAGFAFLSGWSHSGAAVDWCMSEFFVMRKYRRCGFGRHAAYQIICGHPGVWEIPIASYILPAAALLEECRGLSAEPRHRRVYRRWHPMVRPHPSADTKAASKCRFTMIYNSTASAQCSPRAIGLARFGFTARMRSV